MPDAAPTSVAFQPVEKTSESQLIAPLVVYFPSGYRPGGDNECSWELQSRTDARDHLLIGRTGAVDFVGQTRDTKATRLPCRYAVGVLDRTNGTLRYSEIEGGHIIRLEPRARALSYEPTSTGVVTEPQNRAELAAKSRRLTEAFGSARRKRALNTREEAKIETEGVQGLDGVKDMIQNLGEQAAAEGVTREEVLLQAQEHRKLPPHNPTATKPADAYRLSELVPVEAAVSIQTDELQKAINDRMFRTSLAIDSQVHPFVVSRLDTIARPDAAATKDYLIAAAYLSALLKMYGRSPTIKIQTSQGGIAREAEQRAIPVDVLSSILAQFYERHEQEPGSTMHIRSDQQRTMLLLHILTIVLIIERHSLSGDTVDALRSHLKVTPAQLSSMYRELGCVVKSVGTGKSKLVQVTLLPPCIPPKMLQEYFPVMKSGPKRQKKK